MSSSSSYVNTVLVFGALLLAGQHVTCDEEVPLPRSVKVCKSNSPDYSSCMRLALQESWMTFVKGIPEVNIPPLDPLVIEYTENEWQVGEVTGKFALRDVKTYGMAKTNFLAVRSRRSADRLNMEVDVEIPRIFIDGEYKGEGSVGPYKVAGKGYFNISMEGVSATWSLEGRVKEDRWVLEHFHIYPEVQSMKVYFDDLFNGNKELNKLALDFVNDFWQVLLKSMLPAAEEHWDYHLTNYVNQNVFPKISVAKYFP